MGLSISSFSSFSAMAAFGAFMVVSDGAVAADVDGNFAVRGFGSVSCGEFIDIADTGEAEPLLAYASWLQGYLTARNQTTEGTFDTLPVYRPQEMLTLLRAICARNGDVLLETAANGAVELFAETRSDVASELLILERDGQEAAVRSAVLAQVQERLREGGYYNSAVDGVYGSGSAVAIAAYQAATGLPETGLPDLATLVELFTE